MRRGKLDELPARWQMTKRPTKWIDRGPDRDGETFDA